jgi:hypothetical protein
MCFYLREETMTEDGKSKIDYLKRWLIINTVLSPIILLVTYGFLEAWLWYSSVFFLDNLYPLVFIGITWLGAISSSWSNYRKGIRAKAKRWSLLAFWISLFPIFFLILIEVFSPLL